MPTVSILGLGNWGTALGNHLGAKGFDVLGWSNDHEIVDGINRAQQNPKYLAHARLNPKLRATGSFSEAITQDFVVLAVPSSGLGDIVPKLNFNPETVLISAVKGLERQTLLTPLQFAKKYCPVSSPLAVLSGPSFAKDIVAHRPSGVVSASDDSDVAKRVADLFSCDWMKVYISTDTLGVEIGGVVKNVIALAAGVCDGLGLGDSARAGLITRGLAEMMRLAEALGAEKRTLSGLSGLGDLVVTTTSESSRNHTVGVRLGKGESLNQILKTLGSVSEGVHTAPLVLELGKKNGIETPITLQVNRLLKGEITATEAVKGLLSRPVKREFDD